MVGKVGVNTRLGLPQEASVAQIGAGHCSGAVEEGEFAHVHPGHWLKVASVVGTNESWAGNELQAGKPQALRGLRN